jgi:hypothetical protein
MEMNDVASCTVGRRGVSIGVKTCFEVLTAGSTDRNL